MSGYRPHWNEMTAADTAAPTLAITEQALAKVNGFRAQSEDPETQALWVEVSGVSDGEYVYKISLNALHVARQDDVVQRHGDLAIVVPESSVEKLRGATIDWSEGLAQSGLALANPNKPPAPAELPMMSPPMAPAASPPIDAPPPADLSGDVAQRVIQVIDRQVNPAIAAHGGHAELVAVEEDTAYLRLGGGCQGCGMATVTLGQGIEVAITEGVAEIARVVDVTDHAVGTNPYFEPAKK
jgi:Fe/S biogenesis protein NfuA